MEEVSPELLLSAYMQAYAAHATTGTEAVFARKMARAAVDDFIDYAICRGADLRKTAA